MESYEHTTAAAEKIYKEMNKPVIVYRNYGEYPFIPIPHLHSQYEIYYNIQGGRSFFVKQAVLPLRAAFSFLHFYTTYFTKHPLTRM